MIPPLALWVGTGGYGRRATGLSYFTATGPAIVNSSAISRAIASSSGPISSIRCSVRRNAGPTIATAANGRSASSRMGAATALMPSSYS